MNFKHLARSMLMLTAAISALSACGTKAVTPSTPASTTDSVTYCPQNIIRGRRDMTCTTGGGTTGAYVAVTDMNGYINGLSDASPLQMQLTYDGRYQFYVSQSTASASISVRIYDPVTGNSTSTTVQPQSTTTRHTYGGLACGFWCGYLGGKLIDFLWSWITNPCLGDCGQVVVGVPTSSPPPGYQWEPTPILIPTNGTYPPGWGPPPPSNGLPTQGAPAPPCPAGWYMSNCTGNPANNGAN